MKYLTLTLLLVCVTGCKQPEPQETKLSEIRSLWKEYVVECYNDSTYLPQGAYAEGWYHHHEPTFSDFMEWVERERK